MEKSNKKKLTLTPGERLFIARRRAGQSQRAAAEVHGVSLNRYSAWELDQRPAGQRAQLFRLGHVMPSERAVLMRRRRGWTQAQLAETLGCCRFWVMRMETNHADCAPLVRYWKLK